MFGKSDEPQSMRDYVNELVDDHYQMIMGEIGVVAMTHPDIAEQATKRLQQLNRAWLGQDDPYEQAFGQFMRASLSNIH